jgi:uncharacterized protein
MGRCICVVLAALIVAVAGSSALAGAAFAVTVKPSFDCAAANDVIDQTICGDAGLAEADVTMARLYAAARVSAFGQGASNEISAQRDWLKERADCRVVDKRIYKSRSECLTGRYANRNHELAVASLFTEPELAMATLRKLDPEAASLYEVIVTDASAPARTNWTTSPQRSHLLKLLQPYFDQFRTDEQLSFGRDILYDAKIRGPADTLNSEENLIEFLQITSAYLKTDPIPRPFPCAAIVRRPELLDATAAIFGSSLDNFIFYPDCWETLPATPQLERLRDQINKTWPNCDGTIRFSAYRMFGQTVNGARAAGAKEIVDYAKRVGTRRNVRTPRLEGVPPALAEAALAELATYYQTYQKIDAKSARIFATAMIHDMMASGHGCGE